ncbi:MAG: hypothetical protein IMW91_00165 [Firmicutes bacterium]|nr:hypothetical protein [Bacillota bacterium]
MAATSLKAPTVSEGQQDLPPQQGPKHKKGEGQQAMPFALLLAAAGGSQLAPQERASFHRPATPVKGSGDRPAPVAAATGKPQPADGRASFAGRSEWYRLEAEQRDRADGAKETPSSSALARPTQQETVQRPKEEMASKLLKDGVQPGAAAIPGPFPAPQQKPVLQDEQVGQGVPAQRPQPEGGASPKAVLPASSFPAAPPSPPEWAVKQVPASVQGGTSGPKAGGQAPVQEAHRGQSPLSDVPENMPGVSFSAPEHVSDGVTPAPIHSGAPHPGLVAAVGTIGTLPASSGPAVGQTTVPSGHSPTGGEGASTGAMLAAWTHQSASFQPDRWTAAITAGTETLLLSFQQHKEVAQAALSLLPGWLYHQLQQHQGALAQSLAQNGVGWGGLSLAMGSHPGGQENGQPPFPLSYEAEGERPASDGPALPAGHEPVPGPSATARTDYLWFV